MSAVQLFQADPSLLGLPVGIFRYASRDFAKNCLPPRLWKLVERMCEGIDRPRITYQFQKLEPGQQFGHGKFHCDGRQTPDERHRLLTVGGEPTLGIDGAVLSQKTVWEYPGDYEHKAQPVKKATWRLMLRVSDSTIRHRNYWSPPQWL